MSENGGSLAFMEGKRRREKGVRQIKVLVVENEGNGYLQ